MTVCSDYALDVAGAYTTAKNRFGYIFNEISWLFENRGDIGTLTWSQHLKTYMSNVYTCLQMFAYGSTAQDVPDRVPYMLANCLGGTLDMDAILNAMLSADFDELQKFIGISDAYRVALWNAPFNAEFYSALARGFQKWP